jgi:hypothetical protein
VGDLAGEGHADDPALARRLAQRLMPFLLGGLRAPLPQFHEMPRNSPTQEQEPFAKTA